MGSGLQLNSSLGNSKEIYGTVGTTEAYSRKARLYDRFRWDYPPEAIDFILSTAGLGVDSIVADVGAGTGRMTAHLLEVCKRVYAVEPGMEMRAVLCNKYGSSPNFTAVGTSSDEMTIPSDSVHAIVAAQALHWFSGLATRTEFRRILKRDGCLVFIKNNSTNADMGGLLQDLRKVFPQMSALESGHPARIEPEAYFDGAECMHRVFPFADRQDWAHFLGSVLSASWAPDVGTPLYEPIVQHLRRSFLEISENGTIRVEGQSQVIIGRMW